MDFSSILTDLYTFVPLCVLALSLVILAVEYGINYLCVGHYRGPAARKKKENVQQQPPVSVVLTAQNDAEWLRTNLVYLLEQDYPNFEVVVVDYLSNDDTRYVLQLLAETYKNLKIVTFSKNSNGYEGKKFPFSIGIKSAKNDVLLLADPDCMPKDIVNFCWISEMVKGYVHNKVDIVLGYCGIQSKASLFNWLQQYDNLDYSVEYLSSAIRHHPFTGNGRNLSYRRSLFMKNDGFIYHYNIPDGADDMFVNSNARRYNTSVVLTPGSYTTVAPKSSMHQWHLYRKHRTVTHAFYSFGLKLRRLIRPVNVLLFYLSGVALLLWGALPWEILAGTLLVKLIWQVFCTSRATRRLLIKPIVAWLSPFFEIYFLIANTFLAIFPLPKK